MKPSTNVNVARTDSGLRGFRWNYRERKVGVYLTLHCPLRWQETEPRVDGYRFLSWETVVRAELRNTVREGMFTAATLTVTRTTHLYNPDTGRRAYTVGSKNAFYNVSHADLCLRPLWGQGHWEATITQNHGVPGGVKERWVPGKVLGYDDMENHITHSEWRWYNVSSTPSGYPEGFNIPAFHTALRPVVDGCAAQGRFDVLADWFTENAPNCVACLFTEPGDLK